MKSKISDYRLFYNFFIIISFLVLFSCKTADTKQGRFKNLPPDVSPDSPVSLQYNEELESDSQFRYVTVKGKTYMVGSRIPTNLDGVKFICPRYNMVIPFITELNELFEAGEFKEDHYKLPNSQVWTAHKPTKETGYFHFITSNGGISQLDTPLARVYFVCVKVAPKDLFPQNRLK
ncbi:hypothetical protein EHQ81_11165 [Leptospira selangorensis]|uniref:Lipoprotein n=1 Tax=Leptospira selangorensis TaxID=2484982 RepID=A0A4V3JDL4_9LEPT|nr:hypothetical protein [Leptospira selangorensis]TGK10531.1 hypothetical protein EHO58_00690 [Leptospira selangorensis]TGM13388.1 hypothetical protein EHQ81_11165 [Leptospira selangorensis]TGM22270.1 hypothetical protein EHQ82_07560 [Leptospira selangorensis]